jgi:hypothetical protein
VLLLLLVRVALHDPPGCNLVPVEALLALLAGPECRWLEPEQWAQDDLAA